MRTRKVLGPVTAGVLVLTSVSPVVAQEDGEDDSTDDENNGSGATLQTSVSFTVDFGDGTGPQTLAADEYEAGEEEFDVEAGAATPTPPSAATPSP